MHWLSPSDFGRILVPFPDTELLEAVHAVSEARRRFRAWTDQAEAMLVSSVDAQDSDTARERLLDSSGILGEESDVSENGARRRPRAEGSWRWPTQPGQDVSEDGARRRPRVLSPEARSEIFSA